MRSSRLRESGGAVRRTVDDHRSLFEKSEIHIETALPADRIAVNADRTRLAQVVGNLLQNAAKFTGRGGHTQVSVDLDDAARQAIIRVADTGLSISPELLPRLFQPFAQADDILDRGKGGLGLGLALVKGLVELLPGMDGYEVARAFRADGALKDVFLVALSGYALPEDQQRAAEAGFDQHVAKPPRLDKLEELLSSLRERSSSAQ